MYSLSTRPLSKHPTFRSQWLSRPGPPPPLTHLGPPPHSPTWAPPPTHPPGPPPHSPTWVHPPTHPPGSTHHSPTRVHPPTHPPGSTHHSPTWAHPPTYPPGSTHPLTHLDPPTHSPTWTHTFPNPSGPPTHSPTATWTHHTIAAHLQQQQQAANVHVLVWPSRRERCDFHNTAPGPSQPGQPCPSPVALADSTVSHSVTDSAVYSLQSGRKMHCSIK